MSYRNKTYVIFDGDEDMWAYAYMKGWKKNQNIDFNFHDAHDLNTITNRANKETTRRKLRTRFSSAKQVIVLIGEHTKNLTKFVRWEMDVALGLDLPIIAVNLNGKRKMDSDRCPAILKGKYVIHIPFKMKIIKYALDNFPESYKNRHEHPGVDWYYKDSVYKSLDL